jgi:uncharacterized protein
LAAKRWGVIDVPDAVLAPIEVVQQVYASHENRDTPMLVDVLDPDVEWFTAQGHPYARTRPWRGVDEVVREVVEHVNDDWEGYATEVHEMVAFGDEVLVTGRYTGRFRATGRHLDAEVCTIYTVRASKIVRFRQYTDTAQFRAVMGLSMDHTEQGDVSR